MRTAVRDGLERDGDVRFDNMTAREALEHEARRQLANARELYDGSKAERESNLRRAIQQRAYARMTHILDSASTRLLIIGQGHFVLDNDAKLARATFADLAGWMPYFDAAGPAALDELHSLLEPLVCLLLASDTSSLARITALDWDTAAVAPNFYRARFTRDLIDLLRTGAIDRAGERKPIPSKFMFSAYDVLLSNIADKDDSLFEANRASLEAAYPTRKKKREPGLNWYGYGKLSQACTFDALGTAICRLAVRRGLRVDVDTRLYPAAFIRGAA